MKPKLPNTTINDARIFKMVNDVDTLKSKTERQIDGKFAEIEGVLTETKDTIKVAEDVIVEASKITKELDSKFETLSNEVVEVLNEIKTTGLKGEPGENADEEAMEERLLAKIPKLETIVKELPTKEEIVKEVIKQIPENKPSLKVIQESIDIEEVASKVEEKLNEKPFEIDRVNGLSKKLDNITRDVARKTGYHGGGDTVKAGTNIAITTDGTGAKVISATGSGTGSVTDVSVVAANGLAGTVATSTTTPAITLSTTVTGLVKGNGTALSAAVANTDYQSPITLTTTGSSGASTFDGTTLNIPQYSGGGTGDVVGPASATDNAIARFDGTTGKLIQNSAATIADTSGNITAGTYNGNTIGAGSTSGTNTGDQTTITGNAGTATALQTARTIGTITGDATSAGSTFDGSANNTNALTLATVNSNVGTFGSATQASQVTVNAKGLVTAASSTTITPAVGSITGLGTGVGTFLATPSSANLAAALTDETGSGSAVFGTSPTLTTPTLQASKIDYVIEPATDDTFEGEMTNDVLAGDTIAQWDMVYLDNTSGRWEKTDADAIGTAGNVLIAMAAEAGTDGNAMNVVFRGIVRNDGWTWSVKGAPLYLSTTASAISETAPSGEDDVVRIVGHVISDDCIYLNPSPNWIIYKS